MKYKALEKSLEHFNIKRVANLMLYSQDQAEEFKKEIRRRFKTVYKRALSYSDLFAKAISQFNNQERAKAYINLNHVVERRRAILDPEHS